MIKEKLFCYTMLLFWLIISFYLGTASIISTKEIEDYNESKKIKEISKQNDTIAVVYDGIYFKNSQEMENFIVDEKYSNVITFFDWSSRIPDFLLIIIGACSFGLLGSVTRIFYEHIFYKNEMHENHYIILPVLGFISGFFSIGISYLLPNIFLKNASMTNPVGLIFFSLLFGYFIKEFFQNISSKIFNQSN